MRPINHETMAVSRFCRYQLRTTDLNAARVFYADVLGAGFWGDQREVSLVPLPERAAAQGAPAHWLGHIGVADVEKTAGLIAAQGGQQLGPMQQGADGMSHAVFRDPFGAIMAVGPATEDAGREPIAWHMSHSQDHAAAFAWYANLFGWTATETWDLGPTMGCHQVFAWDESGSNVGSMANTARLPDIHPQWLFYFRVANLETALATVRARGGTVVGPMQTPSGEVVAACNDPQGGAFALYQFAAVEAIVDLDPSEVAATQISVLGAGTAESLRREPGQHSHDSTQPLQAPDGIVRLGQDRRLGPGALPRPRRHIAFAALPSLSSR